MILPKGYLKFGGWTVLLGGLMGVIGQVLHAGDTPASVQEIPAFLDKAVNLHVLLAWSSTLILMGLPALYLRQAAGLKKWGWAGLPLLFIAMMFEIFHGPVQILAYPILFGSIETEEALKAVSDQINNMAIDQYPLQLAVLIPIVPFLFLGMLLLGLATLKAKVLPKGPGILMLTVLVLMIAGRFIPLHVFEYAFSFIHVAFVYYGATLAFERPAVSAAADNAAPAA